MEGGKAREIIKQSINDLRKVNGRSETKTKCKNKKERRTGEGKKGSKYGSRGTIKNNNEDQRRLNGGVGTRKKERHKQKGISVGENEC